MLAGIVMKGGGYGLHRGERALPSLGVPDAGWGGTGIAAFVGATLMIVLQRKIWPAQVAHA